MQNSAAKASCSCKAGEPYVFLVTCAEIWFVLAGDKKDLKHICPRAKRVFINTPGSTTTVFFKLRDK